MGGPLPLLTFRLEAVPEMGYDPMANPPRGEIIIKGPVVFQGYFKVRARSRTCQEVSLHGHDKASLPACVKPSSLHQQLCTRAQELLDARCKHWCDAICPEISAGRLGR